MPRPRSSLAQEAARRPQSGGRVAIIDIGSNSMRFVVYDQLKRAPVPLYNEKVMCQLGRGLAASGALNPEGVAMARQAMRRFMALARNTEVSSLYVMATAAVRDARDGAEFARSLEEEYGIEVDIVSGEREARLGAHGICSSVYQPRGLTGDLGGGSMELVHIRHTKLLEHATLPIGPLRLLDETRGHKSELKRRIGLAFDRIGWMQSIESKDFYAIGGSFRAIARVHMEMTGYPLRILHQYMVEAEQFAEFARELASFPEERLEKLPGLPARRVPAMPAAAMILEHVIKAASLKRIVFSASGIREGYLYEKLSPYLRDQDALIASCTDMVNRTRPFSAYANELTEWMQPLLDAESTPERRLRFAFCLLSDIAHHIHPEYRAEWAMQRILQSAFIGITHRERAQLALALYYRYQYRLRQEFPVLALLDKRARAWALLIGSCANLAFHLTGSIAGTLPLTALKPERKRSVVLTVSPHAEDLMGEAIGKRIGGVSEAYKEWMEQV